MYRKIVAALVASALCAPAGRTYGFVYALTRQESCDRTRYPVSAPDRPDLIRAAQWARRN